MHGMRKLTLVKNTTRIQRIRANPALCGRHWLDVGHVLFVASVLDAHGASGSNRASRFKGDLEIHSSTWEHSTIQVEGLHVKAILDENILNTRMVVS